MSKIICPSCMKEVEKSSFCELCHENILLNSKYYLLKILGKNIGITYLAEDLYGKKVVIKELSLRSVDKWKSEEHFKKEGKILSQLEHPLIPNFIEEFQSGIGKNENHYIVMEFIEGVTLRDEFTNKRYTKDEVIDILIGIAEILQYLHSLMPPVVHRDIKLSNLIRKKDKKIALIDFGSVKDIVKNSTLSGTFGFMAPEQFKGESRIENDFYSLGVIAIVLLSRKEPEDMMDDGITLKWKEHLFVSNNFKNLLEKLLDIKPSNRINDATFLIKELNRIKEGKNISLSNQDNSTPLKSKTQDLHEKMSTQVSIYSNSFIDIYGKMEDNLILLKDSNDYIGWKDNADAILGLTMIAGTPALWYIYNWYIALGGLVAFVFIFMTITSPFYKKRSNKFLDEFLNNLNDINDKAMMLAVLEKWVSNHDFGTEFNEAFEKRVAKLNKNYHINKLELSLYKKEMNKDYQFTFFMESFKEKEVENEEE